MTCKYPDCVGGQNGTHCAGPCQQGRLPCPTPEACESPEPEPVNLKVDFLLAAALVAAILFILWVLS